MPLTHEDSVAQEDCSVAVLQKHPPRPKIDHDARALAYQSFSLAEQRKAICFLKDGVISYDPDLSASDVKQLDQLYQQVNCIKAQNLTIMGGRQELCLTLADIHKLPSRLRKKLFSAFNEAHVQHYFGSNSIHVFGVRFHITEGGANAQDWHKDVPFSYVNTVVTNIVAFKPNARAAVATEVVRGSMSVSMSCDFTDGRCTKRAKVATRASDTDAAIMFDSALIHRGGANKTKDRCVKIIVAYVNDNAHHDARKIEIAFVGESQPAVAHDQHWSLNQLR